MKTVSEKYKKYVSESISFSPKADIKIMTEENPEGVTLGSALKAFPKFKQKCSSFIGGFPLKTVSFDFYTERAGIDVTSNAIAEVSTGFKIDDEIELINHGYFFTTDNNIKKDISTNVISLTDVSGYEKMFDIPYISKLNWDTTHSGKEIAIDICDCAGITIDKNTDFAFADYQLKQPNFKEGTTCREALSRLAEISGAIVLIDPVKGVYIKGQTHTGDTIKRHRYSKLTKGNKFAPNRLVLGKEGMSDDIVFPEKLAVGITPVEVKILDNPYVDLYREEMIEEVAKHVLSISYTPFTLEGFIDGSMYELNDVVNVIDRNGETFEAVILGIESTTRYKSTISAEPYDSAKTDSNLAGSQRQGINRVKLEVDHINKTITSIAEKVNENDETYKTLIEQTAEKIRTEVSESYTSKEELKQEVEDAISGIEIGVMYTWVRYADDENGAGISADPTGKAYIGVSTNHTSPEPSDNPADYTWVKVKGDDGKDGTNGKDGANGTDGINGKDAAFQGDTPPEDTSLLWYDTTTNQLKHYSDGEWLIVNDWQSALGSLGENLNNIENDLNQKIDDTNSKIIETEKTLKTQLEQNAHGWDFNFQELLKQVVDIDGTVKENYNEILKYIRFKDGKIILGESNSLISLTLENDILYFEESGVKVAYISNGRLFITDGEFTQSLIIGDFGFTPRANGSLDFGKVRR